MISTPIPTPIKVFGIRTELLNNINNAIFVRKEGASKRKLGDVIMVEEHRARLGPILTV